MASSSKLTLEQVRAEMKTMLRKKGVSLEALARARSAAVVERYRRGIREPNIEPAPRLAGTRRARG